MRSLSMIASALMVASLARSARADDAPMGAPVPLSPDATSVEKTDENHRWESLAGLAALYGGLTTWAYFAWYHDVPDLPEFSVGGDGYFGVDTYAGGADKLGHAWANLALSRGSTEILRWGGWGRGAASAIGSGLSWAFFLFVEIKDGFYYQLSPGDLIGNTAGAALSAAMVNWPALDDAIDFRVEYWPSPEYRHRVSSDGDVNVAEDYSGQTYLLAFHLGALRPLREQRWGRLSRYVDVAVGFETRNYKPDPVGPHPDERQKLFFAVALNLQGVIDDALEGRSGGAARIGRKIGHGVFELLSPPFTALPVVDASRAQMR